MSLLAAAEGTINVVFGSFETKALWVILGISLLALVFAYYLVREVLGASEGTESMRSIARAIQEGASAYLRRQFTTLGVFLIALTVVLFFLLPVPSDAEHSEFVLRFGRSLAFILGAGFSALTGFAGMWLAVRANVRTANAAREDGLRRAMRIAKCLMLTIRQSKQAKRRRSWLQRPQKVSTTTPLNCTQHFSKSSTNSRGRRLAYFPEPRE